MNYDKRLRAKHGAFFDHLPFADVALIAEDHIVHVTIANLRLFLLHRIIPFCYSLTRTVYAGKREKLYEKGQRKEKDGKAIF